MVKFGGSFFLTEERLAKGDPELLRIQSGDAFVELESRKSGIRDAFARREARIEGIYMEIDEKKEASEGLRQALLIKEVYGYFLLNGCQTNLFDGILNGFSERK